MSSRTVMKQATVLGAGPCRRAKRWAAIKRTPRAIRTTLGVYLLAARSTRGARSCLEDTKVPTISTSNQQTDGRIHEGVHRL